MQILPTL